MNELTEVQKKVYEFILYFIEEHGLPPTFREIQQHFKWKSIGTVQDCVAVLVKKNYLLKTQNGKSRQFIPNKRKLNQTELLKQHEPQNVVNFVESSFLNREFIFFKVPFVGKISAGIPNISYEDISEFSFFPIEKRLIHKNKKYFSLQVEGESMINSGILHDDFILVEESMDVKNNQIVVARLYDNEFTVKRFVTKNTPLFKKCESILNEKNIALNPKTKAYLFPENPVFLPTPFGLSDGDKIIGFVRSLYRNHIL